MTGRYSAVAHSSQSLLFGVDTAPAEQQTAIEIMLGFPGERGVIAGSMCATSRVLHIHIQDVISLLTQELWKYEKYISIQFIKVNELV